MPIGAVDGLLGFGTHGEEESCMAMAFEVVIQ